MARHSRFMARHSRFMVWNSRFIVRDSRFMAWDSRFMVWDSRFVVRDSRFMVWDAGPHPQDVRTDIPSPPCLLHGRDPAQQVSPTHPLIARGMYLRRVSGFRGETRRRVQGSEFRGSGVIRRAAQGATGPGRATPATAPPVARHALQRSDIMQGFVALFSGSLERERE